MPTSVPPPLWSPGPAPTLLASRRIDGGEIVFPVVPDHSPLAGQHATVPIEGTGTVYSHTVFHPGPKSGIAPYALAYVDFPGPVRLFGRLQGTTAPRIGQRCTVVPDESLGWVFTVLAS